MSVHACMSAQSQDRSAGKTGVQADLRFHRLQWRRPLLARHSRQPLLRRTLHTLQFKYPVMHGIVVSKALHGLAPHRYSNQSPQKILADTCSVLCTLRQSQHAHASVGRLGQRTQVACTACSLLLKLSTCTFSELVRGIAGAGALLVLPIAAPLVIFLEAPRVEVIEGGSRGSIPARPNKCQKRPTMCGGARRRRSSLYSCIQHNQARASHLPSHHGQAG